MVTPTPSPAISMSKVSMPARSRPRTETKNNEGVRGTLRRARHDAIDQPEGRCDGSLFSRSSTHRRGVGDVHAVRTPPETFHRPRAAEALADRRSGAAGMAGR